MLNQKPAHYYLAFFSLLLFVIVGYGIERYETTPLFFCYFALFTLYVLLLRRQVQINDRELSFWIFVSLLYRAVLLFSTPQLSDDFYRFIWDGRVLAAGDNPFSEVPSHYMSPLHELPGLDFDLYDQLNSKHRYSSYPPVCQLVYWISVKLSPDSVHGSVLVMKNILFLFEIGTLWILKKLIAHFKLTPSTILIYALNPLVILEISGNIHFEGVMVFFLLAAIYFLAKQRLFLSSTTFALSVGTKLIPLLFLPLLFHPLGWKKAIVFWLITVTVAAILFLPLLDQDITHGFSTSLGYYFQRFEFNASLYYLIRAAGFLLFGFNIIHYAGPFLALTATLTILIISFRTFKSHLSDNITPPIFTAMLWCLSVYFLSTTILHPWYIITLLAISIFTTYRFPVVWTAMIFITYAGYTKNSFRENFFLVTLEYVIVIAYLLYEIQWKKLKSHS